MNLQRPRSGEFHKAIYYKKIKEPYLDENGDMVNYEDGVQFEFKAPDDEQYRLRMQQYSQGYMVDNASFSIYTTDTIDIVPNSKVYIVNEDREFKIEETRSMYNSSISIVNSMFPRRKSNKSKWMKLGSLD